MTAALYGRHHVTHTVYTVCGTGVGWNVGYPYDLGVALEATGLYAQQPIGYPAQAFPMRPSINAGETELARQIRLRSPLQTWAMIGYSQGAIITSNIYDRIRRGDLQAYRDSFIGAVTFGNPRRQAGHTIPGGIDPGGHGIVGPNLVNTEAKWWDFADGKKMAGSPGDDLYTVAGTGGAAESADEAAIWNIVDTGNPISLAEALLKLAVDPLNGGVGAAEAIFHALDFFVAQGITPHTSYQFVQPIPGDPRDCWRLGLDYLTTIGAAVPARTAA